MISSVVQFIKSLERDLKLWPENCRPWFRGESGKVEPLTPKVADIQPNEEMFLLQSFRRKAGGLFPNTPQRENETDLWLFLAQHYGVKTRLLDWTEGALIALFFAVNRGNSDPRIYMLNPHRLNNLASEKFKTKIDYPNFPLSWGNRDGGNIWLAWALQEERDKHPDIGLELPIAIPATYQDHRMIAQRSCFTIHGKSLRGLDVLLSDAIPNISEYLITYKISSKASSKITKQLFYLGISAATIFPDLDNLSRDLNYEVSS
jgi:hypothetical protein